MKPRNIDNDIVMKYQPIKNLKSTQDCSYCGVEIPKGDSAVMISRWHNGPFVSYWFCCSDCDMRYDNMPNAFGVFRNDD